MLISVSLCSSETEDEIASSSELVTDLAKQNDELRKTLQR